MSSSLDGFSERMRSLLLYKPFFSMGGLRRFPEIDVTSLGFALLLFLLDNMLDNKSKCDIDDIATFLGKTISENYDIEIDRTDLGDITSYMLDSLRNNGKPFVYYFRDIENAKDEEARFKLIEVTQYRVGERPDYKLTAEGLDILFRTREVFKELRLSISQLYFRQQIERGVFSEAIETVRNMVADVRSTQEELDLLKWQILKNIGDLPFEKYRSKIEEVYRRLNREREVFSSLKSLIVNTRDVLFRKSRTKKEEESLDQITKIENLLFTAINEHSKLFNYKLRLDRLFLEVVESSIVNSFITKVSFEHDFLDNIVRGQTDIEDIRKLLSAFLPSRLGKSFNPLRSMIRQNLYSTQSESDDSVLSILQIDEEVAREKREKKRRDAQTMELLKTILHYVNRRESFTLAELLSQLPRDDYDRLTGRLDFFSIIVQLHQMEPLSLSPDEDLRKNVVDSSEDNLPYLFLKALEKYIDDGDGFMLNIREGELLQLGNGCLITNYHFSKVREAYA